MCVLKNITENISSFFNKDDRKRHKVRNLKKEEINTYLKRMAAFLLVLLYYELLLYYQLHGALNTMSVYNILFLVPIAALLAALTGWFRACVAWRHGTGQAHPRGAEKQRECQNSTI